MIWQSFGIWIVVFLGFAVPADRCPELPQPLAESAASAGKAFGPEHEQSDGQNDE